MVVGERPVLLFASLITSFLSGIGHRLLNNFPNVGLSLLITRPLRVHGECSNKHLKGLSMAGHDDSDSEDEQQFVVGKAALLLYRQSSGTDARFQR